jgi:hypothetical protein
MDAGPNMLYPAQCVDGLVRAADPAAGKAAAAAAALQSLPLAAGSAVRAAAGDTLSTLLGVGRLELIHCVTPYRSAQGSDSALRACYASALRCAQELAEELGRADAQPRAGQARRPEQERERQASHLERHPGPPALRAEPAYGDPACGDPLVVTFPLLGAGAKGFSSEDAALASAACFAASLGPASPSPLLVRCVAFCDADALVWSAALERSLGASNTLP